MAKGKQLKPQERDELLQELKTRFEKNMQRHKGVAWKDVEAKLDEDPTALASLHAMESSGGEPDVIGQDKKTGQVVFCDCSAQSPSGRRRYATIVKR